MTNGTAVTPVVTPLPGFAALDGCHCVTNSLAKIFYYFGHPLSEEMLFGLGPAWASVIGG